MRRGLYSADKVVMLGRRGGWVLFLDDSSGTIFTITHQALALSYSTQDSPARRLVAITALKGRTGVRIDETGSLGYS